MRHRSKRIPAAALFWAAYVLTRPLGATLGDTLTKAHNEGGLALGRIVSSLAIVAVMVVAILLTTAIDKDHVNKLGWTALLEAVILGDGGPVHTRIVKLLLDAGANPNIADGNGVTPLAHARQRGFGGMVQLLEKAGAR